ncbi:hypothetical protein CCR75_003223 [Bremia lactucae]|uniref:Uncharacterized protein n=1 Tax=Bremia lactucae TaxID=4779 RepID=A0A976FP41_BRELC|nr:hypothetical protein CCR75_003223 [Bremia lactucae]
MCPTDRVSTEKVFSKLKQLLIEVAEDVFNCLGDFNSNLSAFDSRHEKLFSGNTSTFYLKSYIQTARDTTLELRNVAHQIAECSQPSQPEIDAACNAMHATVNSLNELARMACQFDKESLNLNGLSVVAGSLEAKASSTIKNDTNTTGKDLTSIRNKRSESEALRASGTVEEVVAMAFGHCFGKFRALQHQVATSEKALSPLFAGRVNELVAESCAP